MAVARAHNTSGIGTRQLSPVKHGFEDAAGLGRQSIEPDFFFSPKKDACPQMIRLHQAFHEFDLVDTCSEKEVCESRESLLAQIAASIKIVTADAIACSKVPLIRINIARQTARH